MKRVPLATDRDIAGFDGAAGFGQNAAMSSTERLFSTSIYRAELAGRGAKRLVDDLKAACLAIATDDRAGQAWARDNGYQGYTSYASLNDLPWRSPEFADLKVHLDRHVAAFAEEADFELGEGTLELDSLWINVLEPGGMHSSHIHPLSVVSGTCYVEVPKGASALKFEDPRLGLMMASPPRRSNARRDNESFVYLAPKPGTVVLWESWLRHEVTLNAASTSRISVSFNYRWER